MRVTIEHREEKAGLSGSKRRYFVDCSVVFSEEEKAIIKQRGLDDQSIKTESAIPIGSGIDDYTFANTGLRMLSRLLVLGAIGAVGWGIIVKGNDPGPIILICLLGALSIFVFRKFAERRANASYEQRVITVRQLLKDPRFTIFASNPAEAQAHEADIREQLVNLKGVIAASAEVPKKHTFEL